jgi:hypothetical protein
MSMSQAYRRAFIRKQIVKEVLSRVDGYVAYMNIARGGFNLRRFENDDWVMGALELLASRGYPYAVCAGSIEDIGRLPDIGRPVGKWTMVVDGAFAFTDHTDAVAYRLLVT